MDKPRFDVYPSANELSRSRDPQLVSLDIVRPTVSARRLAYALIFVLLSSVALISVLPWQQTSWGTGSVVPYHPNERLQKVNAPVKGLILKWHVVEGAEVEAGDPIADITDFDPQYFDRIKLQLVATQQALEASRIALETSNRNLERQKKLAERGLKSQRDYELAKLEYNKFVAEVSGKEKDLAEIQSKLSRQAMQQVVAPRKGQIMRIFFPQGGAVIKEGDTLATLAPDTDELVVELYIDGNDLPLLEIGRKARLQFEGWPAIQFSGWPSVAVGTFGGLIKTIDPSDSGGGKFRILVEPDVSDTPWPTRPILRQGVRAKGWVMLDTVPLWYELWRRFNGFPPTLGTVKNSFGKEGKSAEKLGKSLKKFGK